MSQDARFSERAVAELIEQLGRAATGEAFAAGLNPAQWAALRYFSRANRFSRTVGAFARFHGTTRGTTSQTVKALVRKGYLERHPVGGDRRSFRLDLTGKARRCLPEDPFLELVAVARALSPAQRAALAEGLEAMLDEVLRGRGRLRFGICALCRHLRIEGCCREAAGPHECGLLGEPLSEEETAELCVNFENAPAAPGLSPS